MRLTRRFVLGGLLSGVAQAGWAGAPASSVRPRPRGGVAAVIPTAEELVASAQLGGSVSFVVADARSGQVLETRGPHQAQPPASTAKAITTLYALDALGPAHVFRTRLIATGPVQNGRIQGDLILAGGGDPVLDTDALAEMARRLKEAGVREIAGSFKVWDGALPRLNRIDPEQPEHVSYNPALGGLNLNFNRVYFGWQKSGNGYTVEMDARSATVQPPVTLARMTVVDRATPVYTYEDRDGRDVWTVARAALGEGGSRWLPVRRPALYAAEVFHSLARSQGILLGQAAERVEAVPPGPVLVEHESVPLAEILRDMLRYSTNSTAELVGLAASAARGSVPGSLRDSAAQMNAWLAEFVGGAPSAFVDHSGLGDDSRISAATMVRAMVRAGTDGALRDLMKSFPVEELPDAPVQAKTGTLNFVNALAGYIDAPDGSDLAFAIFCSDVERRDALSMEERERPEGGRSYATRARTLQRGLIERWAAVYGSETAG